MLSATEDRSAQGWRRLFAARVAGMENDALAGILGLAGRSDIISFAGGLPDPQTFLHERLAEVAAHVITTAPGVTLQYGPTPGLPDTRAWFRSYLQRREGRSPAQEAVLVTSGGIEALDLLHKILVDRDDVVLMEAPTYLGAAMVTASYQGRVCGAPIDEQGLSVDALNELLDRLARQGRRPKFLYTIPDHQNPSGITMTRERRAALVTLAATRGLLLVEDIAYRRLGFDDTPPPTLWSHNPDGVVLIDTVAKTLFPAARLALVAAPPEIVAMMTLAKQTTDQFASTLSQTILLEFDRRGWWEEQMAHAREVYAVRCGAMLDGMSRLLPEGLGWTRPRGGFFTWVTLPEGADSTRMVTAATEAGVAYVPGQPFFAPEAGGRGRTPCYLRLSYSYVPRDRIDEGLRRLGMVITRDLSGSPSAGESGAATRHGDPA